MTATPTYAERVIRIIRITVDLTPASWTQWAIELSNDDTHARTLWDRLACHSGVNGELTSRVKAQVLAYIRGLAGVEYEDALTRSRNAAQRLADEAAR